MGWRVFRRRCAGPGALACRALSPLPRAIDGGDSMRAPISPSRHFLETRRQSTYKVHATTSTITQFAAPRLALFDRALRCLLDLSSLIRLLVAALLSHTYKVILAFCGGPGGGNPQAVVSGESCGSLGAAARRIAAIDSVVQLHSSSPLFMPLRFCATAPLTRDPSLV